MCVIIVSHNGNACSLVWLCSVDKVARKGRLQLSANILDHDLLKLVDLFSKGELHAVSLSHSASTIKKISPNSI